MTSGAVKTLQDRRKLHLKEIGELEVRKAELDAELSAVNGRIDRSRGVVADMEEGILALGGTIED